MPGVSEMAREEEERYHGVKPKREEGLEGIGAAIKRLNTKDTNPKDAVGIRKIPLSTISAPVLAEVGVGMLEGARKYGRHNYRVASVRASVYYDAAFRHLTAFWEGEDIDPESGISHISKAIAGLAVMRDAMIQNKFVDDRPPASPKDWQKNMQPVIDAIFERHPEAKDAYTEKENPSGNKETLA